MRMKESFPSFFIVYIFRGKEEKEIINMKLIDKYLNN